MSEEDYELRWPRQLLRDELGELVNEPSCARWKDRVTLTLNDAFTTAVPADEFSELCDAPRLRVDPWTTQQDPWSQPATKTLPAEQRFIVDLLCGLDIIPLVGPHVPYFSQRAAGAGTNQLNLRGVATEVRALLYSLDSRGYFERAFGKDCVDDPAGQSPEEVIEARLGRTIAALPAWMWIIWPLVREAAVTRWGRRRA